MHTNIHTHIVFDHHCVSMSICSLEFGNIKLSHKTSWWLRSSLVIYFNFKSICLYYVLYLFFLCCFLFFSCDQWCFETILFNVFILYIKKSEVVVKIRSTVVGTAINKYNLRYLTNVLFY